MTLKEYCSELDVMDSDKSLSYFAKAKKAYGVNKSLFNKCVQASTLYGKDRFNWGELFKEDSFASIREEIGNIEVYSRKVWKAVFSACKYLSSEVTQSYASYVCTLVENSIGSRRQCLSLSLERDKQQFRLVLGLAGIRGGEAEACVKLVKDTMRKLSKKEQARIGKLYNSFYEACNVIVKS